MLSAHTGVANVHLFASEQPTSKKGRVFVEKPMAEGGLKKHSLKRNDANVDEAVALGIMVYTPLTPTLVN